MTKKSSTAPPPVIEGGRVVEYAVNPNLAIAQPLREGEILFLRCDAKWNVTEATQHPSVRQAKQKAERTNPGVAWQPAAFSDSEVEKFLEKTSKDAKCSFCNRRPDQVAHMIAKEKVRICDFCVREAYSQLS